MYTEVRFYYKATAWFTLFIIKLISVRKQLPLERFLLPVELLFLKDLMLLFS